MANYGSNYDWRSRDRDVRRGSGPRSGSEFRSGRAAFMGYGSDYGARGAGGYARYDRDLSRVEGRGYEGEYKSDWQTNQGDPFGDRARRTPFRVMRGSFEDQFPDRERSFGYDRSDYGSRWGSQNHSRGLFGSPSERQQYDRGWFGNRQDMQQYDRGLFERRTGRPGYDQGLFGSRSDPRRYDEGFFSRSRPKRYDTWW